MKDKNKYTLIWYFLTAGSLLLGLFFIAIVLVPFELQKVIIDSLAADGNVESYNHFVYSWLRIVAGIPAFFFISIFISLIFRKNQAIGFMQACTAKMVVLLQQISKDLKSFISWISPQKADLVPLVILGIMTFLGVFFRYAYLWRPMGHDESYTFMAFASRGLRFVITDYHLPNNHVFHTILVNLAYEFFGDSPAVIRLPAFTAGVLIIPMTYIVARIFSNNRAALLSASLAASIPVLIDYSTSARGYTMLVLFFLLILSLAAFVKDNKNLIGWFLLISFSILGLYTVPTMVYPVGMVLTWLLISMLVKDVDREYGTRFIIFLLISTFSIGLIAGLLYLPIVAYSGIGSIVGNGIVKALSWQDFTESVPVRIKNTWAEWNRDLPNWITWLALTSFGASLFVPSHALNQRRRIVFAGIISIGALILIQRVAPWPRIWLFLLPLFIIWIAAGFVGLLELGSKSIPRGDLIFSIMVGILTAAILSLSFMRSYTQYDQKLHTKGGVEELAVTLQGELQSNDIVVVTSPDAIILKYYFRRLGLSNDLTELHEGRFFERAIVVVNHAYDQDLEYVLAKRGFLDDVDIDSAELIYQTNRYHIYQLEEN